MALKNSVSAIALAVLGSTSAAPRTPNDWKRVGAARLAVGGTLSLAASKSLAELKRRVEICERVDGLLAEVEDAAAQFSLTGTCGDWDTDPRGWSVDGIPGTSPRSILTTLESPNGLNKAGVADREGRLAKILEG